MNRRPGFWILLLLFLGLAGWLRYGLRPDGTHRPDDTNSSAVLAPFVSIEPTRVTSILVAFSIDSTRMERVDQRWWIVSPFRFPADPVAVEALLERCRALIPRSIVPIEPGPGDPYGVKDPMVVVEFGLSDGSSRKLEFGNLAPASAAFYLRATGRDSLALIAETEADTYFRRDVDSWRDPTLFDFDPAAVIGVWLERPGSRVSIEREPGGESWRVIEPFVGLANSADALEFVKDLRSMRARSFPASLTVQQKTVPIYETHRGWLADTSGAKKLSDLPVNARKYLKRLSGLLGVPITILSVGSHEKQTLHLGSRNGRGCF